MAAGDAPAVVQGADGSWRAAVTFTRLMSLSELNSPFGGTGDVPMPFTFEQTKRAHELRPAPTTDAADVAHGTMP
jgi:hypothetical protein